MPSGNISLYLDIYIGGRRTYEYLHLYLREEKNRIDKETNKETLRLAEAIRAKRVVELQNNRFGFTPSWGDTYFLDYFKKVCDENKNAWSESNWYSWDVTYRYLLRYCKANTKIKDIDLDWVQGFKTFLDKTYGLGINGKNIKRLSTNSKMVYFQKLKACINKAYKEGLIQSNLIANIENYRFEEHERVYLTIDEVRAMAAGECRLPMLKKAFLFSCLTGLRKSDILKMTWREISQQGEFTRIIFKQKKTKGQEYLDVSPQAAQILGERGDDDSLVFAGFSYSDNTIKELRKWAKRSGVNKELTFHSGRHTFAVLMLDLGTDIYTVQKLLGHRNIQTTAIYAHIMDKKKQQAVSLIPSINLV